MMDGAVGTGLSLGCLLCLIGFKCVYSAVATPCMSQLGLNYGGSQHSLAFDIAVSSGDADDIRLNGPRAWIPLQLIGSFVEINASQPVLLTGIQVQGDPLLSGQIIGWSLETSLDCENYLVENYTLSSVVPAHTETILLKKMEFVTCIRLRPTHCQGDTPALRLELLGCEVNDNSRCEHDVHPVTEVWMADGGRHLGFDQAVVLVWIKVLLEQKLNLDTDVSISYSRSCQFWEYLESSDMNIVSVTSSNHTKRWLTVEIERPVKVKCLRIAPPPETTLKEIHTSACSSHLPSSLLFVGTNMNPISNEKDSKSTVISTTAEIKATLKSATSASSTNVLPVEPTDTTIVSDMNERSTVNNFSIFEADPSENYSQVSNSSTFSDVMFLDKHNPAGMNWSSENIDMVGFDGDVSTSTAEEHANVYNSSGRDRLYNISISENDDDRIANVSTSTSSDSNESVLQPNIASTTESLGVDTLTIGEQSTSGLHNKDYNGTQCGVKKMARGNRRKRVVGGKLNTPGEWPWLVSLHFLIEFEFTRKSGFKHTCGASLVAPGWVLTAAHCFSDDLLEGLSNLTLWRVYFGLHDLAKADSDQFVQERFIEAIYPYPNYNVVDEPLQYDLALVKLNEYVDVNDMVSPVCLDDDTDLHDIESPCFVSGWGQISFTSPGSRFPYTASLSTMTLSKCKDMYDKIPDDNEVKKYARIEPPVLCAAVGDNGEDACQGDSGGPLMCERNGLWYQAGIVSGGFLCGHKATPGLYTRISYYSSWITNTMELFGD